MFNSTLAYARSEEAEKILQIGQRRPRIPDEPLQASCREQWKRPLLMSGPARPLLVVDSGSGAEAVPSVTCQRHQVGDQQKGQCVRGDDHGSVGGRLRCHIHQRASMSVHYPDWSLGGDEHRLHRFGQPIAADRYLGHRCGKLRQLWHQHTGQDQLRNQGQRNDRGRLISRVGKRRDHQSHCRACHRTDRQ